MYQSKVKRTKPRWHAAVLRGVCFWDGVGLWDAGTVTWVMGPGSVRLVGDAMHQHVHAVCHHERSEYMTHRARVACELVGHGACDGTVVRRVGGAVVACSGRVRGRFFEAVVCVEPRQRGAECVS